MGDLLRKGKMKFRDVISEAKSESAEKLNMDLEYY